MGGSSEDIQPGEVTWRVWAKGIGEQDGSIIVKPAPDQPA